MVGGLELSDTLGVTDKGADSSSLESYNADELGLTVWREGGRRDPDQDRHDRQHAAAGGRRARPSSYATSPVMSTPSTCPGRTWGAP